MRHLFPAALMLLMLVATSSCEGDPSRDSSNPGSSVPLDPTRPDVPADNPSLELQTQLEGQYVGGLQITGGNWSGIGARGLIEITFSASGMVGIGQFDVVLTPDPPTAFDMGLSHFASAAPFLTMGTGVKRLEDGSVRFIGVDFQRTSNDTATLGTLRLRTEAAFSADTQVRLPVTFFSMGPSFAERDNYAQADLNVGVVINGE
jgi:hypothetical protein